MHDRAPKSDLGKSLTPTAPSGGPTRYKVVRGIVSLLVVITTVVITLYVWGIVEKHPRTDDAAARANVVGIAPRVSGQTIKLNVVDNQAVKEGDVLFEIDPDDYKLVLEKAKADLAA